MKKIYALKNSYIKSSEAPKITATGKIISNRSVTEVTYNVTFPKDTRYTAAYVTLDQNKLYSGDYKYVNLQNAGTKDEGKVLGVPLDISQDGTVVLSFSSGSYGDNNYAPIYDGSYQLNFIFGDKDPVSGSFIAKTKAAAVTMKVVKPTSLPAVKPAKLNTSYSLKVKVSSQVELSLNNKNHKIIEVGMLFNVNIKGKSNDFTNYFKSPTEWNNERQMYVNKQNNSKIDLIYRFDRIPTTKYEGYVSHVRCQDEYGREYYIGNTKISIAIKDSKPVYKTEPGSLIFNMGDTGAKEITFTKGAGANLSKLNIASFHMDNPYFNVEKLDLGDGEVRVEISLNKSVSVPRGNHILDLWVTDIESGVQGANPGTHKDVGTKVSIDINVL